MALAAPRPFLKWAGGKTQLLPGLLGRLPAGRIDTYYEPFAGGGALFFALSGDPDRTPRRAVLADLNEDLVATYEAVRDRCDDLVVRLGDLASRYACADADARAAQYYAVRDERPTDPIEVAARLIFLNKTCFNGLYRVNRRGEFNVPHGRYKNPRILDESALRAASAALRAVEVRLADFEDACADAGPGDFAYFDPPFHPLSATSSFTSYTSTDFGRPEQRRLKRTIDRLTERGVPVMLSNSPHEWVVGMYDGTFDDDRPRYVVDRMRARRAINSRGDRRGAIDELVVTNYVTGEGS